MKNTTTRGTCHFQSQRHAIAYYATYGMGLEQIDQKITLKEIVIGPPDIKPNEVRSIDRDGRYHITSPDTITAKRRLYYLGKGFDQLEVRTCTKDEDGDVSSEYQPGDEVPAASAFYSLYGHEPEYGWSCIGDFKEFSQATSAAVLLGASQEKPKYNGYDEDEFINYLRTTLIPDLQASGYSATAEDFETALQFINN